MTVTNKEPQKRTRQELPTDIQVNENGNMGRVTIKEMSLTEMAKHLAIIRETLGDYSRLKLEEKALIRAIRNKAGRG